MRILLILLVCLNFRTPLFSQDISYGYPVFYRIATAYNFKNSIISITFDDGNHSQFSLGMPLLNERNIKGTFYVISSELTRNRNNTARDDVKSAFNYHHEIGSHTVHHIAVDKVNRKTIQFELEQSQFAIDSLLGANVCSTIGYPGGRYNDSTIEIGKQYYLAGRSGFSGYNEINPIEKFKLKTIVYSNVKDVSYYNDCVYTAINHGFWLIETYHQIEIGNISLTIKKQDFINHLDVIKSQENKIWIATVSEVVKYIDEKNSAKIFCDSCDDEKFYKFRLEDDLDDSIFNLPLSISMKVPNNWEGITVSGAEYVNVVFEGDNKFVQFNALPNNKDILIKPKIVASPEYSSDTRFIAVEPNPFSNYINVSFETTKPSNIKVVLKSIFGSPLLIDYVVCDPVNEARLTTGQFPKGTYIIELINKTSGQSITKKVIKVE